MLIPTKMQIDKKNYEFIKQFYKELHYKSLSEYIRKAVHTKAAIRRLGDQAIRRLDDQGRAKLTI